MNETINEIAHYIQNTGGKIIVIFNGFDQEFTKAEMQSLPAKKFVLPYVIFNADKKVFLKIGERCIQFNKESKDNDKFIFWKVIIFEWNRDNSEYCLSATTNRMDLHDPSVVTGLTREKRSELLNTSKLLFCDFLNYLRRNTKN
ncbi:MAG: hypothetical protein JNL65_11440 [Saprospiraceae bacterium]|nr:hypothetical protein [Saprospiraceae bacterium]